MNALRDRVETAVRSAINSARTVRRSRRRANPPPCPDGWQTGPPDFVGVGVQRAGTSWWFQELVRHPDVHQADGAPKETHFFDPLSDGRLDAARVAEYHRWFPRPSGGITGEWTPCYVYHPWEVPLLARAAPSTRVLLMLRDPMARFTSGVRFRLDRGWSRSDAVLDAYERGMYARQVANLLRFVDRSRLFVLVYEEALSAPDKLMSKTVEFLGLDPTGLPAPVRVRPSTTSPEASDEVSSELRNELAARYREDIADLEELLPDLDLGRWPTALRV